MKIALRWQTLWPLAITIIIVLLLLVLAVSDHLWLTQKIAETNQIRTNLERVIARLDDRHQRTIRRANAAVLENQQNTREAMLAWASEHYLKEMESYGNKASQAIISAHITDTDSRLRSHRNRLISQIKLILNQARKVADALDSLLIAVNENDDDTILAATQKLERADRSMDILLHTTAALTRQLTAWQIAYTLNTTRTIPWLVIIIIALWIPISFYLAIRPLNRISQLTQNKIASQPLSIEEDNLQKRLIDIDNQQEAQSRQLAERMHEAERNTIVTRRLTQELALLKLYNENLVNSLRAAIIVTDIELNLRSYNRAAKLLLNISDDAVDSNLLEQTIFHALTKQSRDAKNELLRAISERCTLHYDALPYALATGEILLDLVIAPYMNESGAARGLLFVADDVTDTINTKNQLLAAERLAAVGRLSAQVAHEIRNPLSAIALNAELLGEDFAAELGEPKRTEAYKLITAITNEIERLTEVTEGYLHLSRLPRPNLRATDINQLVSDLASMLREEMKAYKIEIQLELDTPPPLAYADSGQLRQALLNVIRNSREAMPNGGVIYINTFAKTSTNQVIIDICDTGTGFLPDVIRRVFEPFYSTKQAGTGLGLSLTQQIVLEHGGKINIANTASGGAKVSLLLKASTAKTTNDTDDSKLNLT
ncbi:MAG: hypothetical protein JW841_15005 [Deltaproteobacteria bacterium]|nr:hypothetical protein [Deltaproteobacteria bacterium]